MLVYNECHLKRSTLYLVAVLCTGLMGHRYQPTSLPLQKDWRQISAFRPEVILTNFTTRLGHTVGRMLASLFHYDPQFQGKRAVTFHNQRDYIFFRHHM